jgi:hypothetical protein
MMDQSKPGLLSRITGQPEFNIYVFAFLLNFVWEFLQMPLFTAPPANMPHWDIVKIYAFATVADGFIMLIAYWTASAFARSRYWFVAAERGHVLIFLITGLAITSAIELIATEMGVWTYSPLMPVLFGVGLSPFLQWVIPPLITLWFTRRQLGV